ncbi:ABC transporter substrate-binding protein [Streptomyces sp. SID8352]|nr:ABC transporter substrate-binding protein [Streptomyces sp. SID8352]
MFSMTMRRRRAVVLLAALGLAATACTAGGSGSGGSGGGGEKRTSDTLTVNWATGNTTLDPAAACNQDDLSLIHNLYSGLTRYATKPGPDGTSEYDPTKIEPSFAKSWTVTDSGRTYTFKLHEGAKFPDGGAMDSAAVKYSVERVLTMGTCATFYLQAGMSAPPLITKVETPDANTVVFRLRAPNADFLAGLATPAGSIVNPAVVEANGGVKKGTLSTWMAGNTAGSGPYSLTTYQPNSTAVLTANPGYWGDRPATPTIRINYVTSAPTLALRAKSGEADVTLGLPPQSVKSLETEKGLRLKAHRAPLFAQVALRNDAAPLDNVKFRAALTLAVPYEKMLESVGFGFGELYYGSVLPGVAGYDAPGSKPLRTDVAEARRLLAESGVKTPVTVPMMINSSAPSAEQLATLLQGVWQEIGVKVEIEKLAPSDFTPRFTKGDYTSALVLEGPGVPTAGYQLALTASCDSPFNNAKVCIPGLDAKLARAQAAPDPGTARKLYAEINSDWRAQSPRIPLYALQHVAVLGTSVTHYSYAKFMDFTDWAVSR